MCKVCSYFKVNLHVLFTVNLDFQWTRHLLVGVFAIFFCCDLRTSGYCQFLSCCFMVGNQLTWMLHCSVSVSWMHNWLKALQPKLYLEIHTLELDNGWMVNKIQIKWTHLVSLVSVLSPLLTLRTTLVFCKVFWTEYIRYWQSCKNQTTWLVQPARLGAHFSPLQREKRRLIKGVWSLPAGWSLWLFREGSILEKKREGQRERGREGEAWVRLGQHYLPSITW